MHFKFVPHLRAGLIAFGFAGIASVSAMAAPVGMANPASPTSDVITIQGDGRFSDCMRAGGGNCYRPGAQSYRNRPARDWEAPREWNRHAGWESGRRHVRPHRDWRPRHYQRDYYRPHYRPDYYRPDYYGSGIYFNYSAPSYRYYEPRRYAPVRRIHRGASSHVRWCQNRYRSYRAWDNTYKPTRHTRRQCISPYN